MASQPSPSRLEAFSDGVIAVIITIMVLEFKVPHADGMAGFRSILPTLTVYLLSFTFTGIHWVNHHHAIDRLKHVDALILWCNLGFLFCLSLLPFFTAYMVEKKLDSFSIALYAASLFFTGVGFTLLGLAIIRHLRLLGHPQGPAEAEQQGAEQKKGFQPLPLSAWDSARVLAPLPRALRYSPCHLDLDYSHLWRTASNGRIARAISLKSIAALHDETPR